MEWLSRVMTITEQALLSASSSGSYVVKNREDINDINERLTMN